MAKPKPIGGNRVSRRDFLFTAAMGTGTIIGAGLVESSALASTKATEKAVQYQATPKGNQRCATCANFQPPVSCKLVDGTISPSGWCVLYQLKK